MLKKGAVVFLFKPNSQLITKAGLFFKLNGYSGERVKISEFGESTLKTYTYPGIPHLKLGHGIILAEGINVSRIEELFKTYQIPHLKIRPRSMKFQNWQHAAG